jgi:hypothetical protein
MLSATTASTGAPEVSSLAREKSWNVDQIWVEQGRLDEVFREITTAEAASRS